MIYRAVDNETFLIERYKPLPKVVCTMWYDGTGHEPEILKHSDYLHEWWKETLSNDDITLIGQYIAYDMGTAASTWPDLLPLVFGKYGKGLVTDISIRQKLFDVASGNVNSDDDLTFYSLKSLSELVLDERMEGKDGGGWRLRFGELFDVSLKDWPKEALDYALSDVSVPWRIWAEQNTARDLIKNENEWAYTEFCLSLLTARGTLVDQEKVKEARHRFEQKQLSLRDDLVKVGLLSVDKKGKVTKKLKVARERVEKACKEKGIKVPLTPTKNVATDIVACRMSGDEHLLKRAEYATAEKMVSTYIKPLEAAGTGPVSGRYGFAVTGRTTCSTPRPPLIGSNDQQAPSKGGVRECLKPREGFCFLTADYEGAELHSLAQTCFDLFGYTVLGDMLNKGVDVHLYVASMLLQRPYEEILPLYLKGDEKIKEARKNAKATNFGRPGGMGPKTFFEIQIKQTGRFWTDLEIKEAFTAWEEAFPEMLNFFAYCKEENGPSDDTVVTECPRINFIRGVRYFTQIANTKFQAPTAKGALAGVRRVVKECFLGGSALEGSRPVKFVHDEIVLETPLDRDLHDVATALDTALSEEFNKFCPDFPTRTEPILSMVWSKKAKQVFDANGRLTIWKP